MKRRYTVSKNIQALFGIGGKNKWVQNLAKDLVPSLSDSDAKKCKIVEKDGLKLLDIKGDVYIVSNDDIRQNQEEKLKKLIDDFLQTIQAGFANNDIPNINDIYERLKNTIDQKQHHIGSDTYFTVKIS